MTRNNGKPTISRPFDVKDGIHLTVDESTGRYHNVPRCLLTVIPQSSAASIINDESIDPSLRPTKLPQHRPENTVHATMNISNPYELQHLTHVTFDPEKGFIGLPPEWERMLKRSGFQDSEIAENPQGVLDVMKFMQTPLQQQPKHAEEADHPMPQLEDFVQKTNPHDFLKDLELMDEGSTCKIYKATDPKTGEAIAVKEMNITEANKKLLFDETRLMASMDHPNIIKFYSAHMLGDTLWIIMELMDGGSLTNVATYCDVQEPHIALFAREVLQALDYMHKHKKIHRDIKTDNVLLKENGEVRLADFGYTAQLESPDETRKSIVGTPYWMAPEVIKGEAQSYPADIWSVGCTCVELIEGAPPYCELDAMTAMKRIPVEGFPGFRMPKTMSKDFKDFVSKCVSRDPNNRWNAAQLMKHPWIRQVDSLDRAEVMKSLTETEIDLHKLLEMVGENTENTLVATARNTLRK